MAPVRRRLIQRIGLIGVLLVVWTTTLDAAKFNKVLDIGKPAPAWMDLMGVDGRKHSLADLKDAKLVIVVFGCNHCPVFKAYERRLIRLLDDTRDQGVELVAISVSKFPSDGFNQMKTRASESGFNFPYLIDPSQKIGKAFGATCTPQLFLLDQQRRVAYMGKMDDHIDESKVTEHFLRDAVQAVLKGQTPEVTETRQFGCDIEYVESR